MKKIKNIFFIGIIAMMAVSMFSGCSSTAVYDKSVPLDQTFELLITSAIYTKSFDGQNMGGKWVAPMAGRTTVRIPAGNHDFTFYVKWSGNIGYQRINILSDDIAISKNFVAGHRYAVVTDPFINALMFGAPGLNNIRVNIVDVTPSSTTNGLVTITNASSLNGKYVIFTAQASSDGYSSLAGFKSRDKKGVIGVKVENGIIELPIWYMHLGVGAEYFNFDWINLGDGILYISDSELFRGRGFLKGPQVKFTNVGFSNGKAEIDLGQGTKENY